MVSTLTVPLDLTVDVHEIEGGSFWGEVRQFPGCVAQAETLDSLKQKILLAIRDWMAEPGVQSERTARELAAIQGAGVTAPLGPYPRAMEYQPPASWTEADEDE
jgi:predicted RNase H-like HicB family nuclease